jgi:hypothetical protein
LSAVRISWPLIVISFSRISTSWISCFGRRTIAAPRVASPKRGPTSAAAATPLVAATAAFFPRGPLILSRSWFSKNTLKTAPWRLVRHVRVTPNAIFSDPKMMFRSPKLVRVSPWQGCVPPRASRGTPFQGCGAPRMIRRARLIAHGVTKVTSVASLSIFGAPQLVGLARWIAFGASQIILRSMQGFNLSQ